MIAHFQGILEGIDPGITSDRFVLSLVDDERHDFVLMEEARAGLVDIGEEDQARVKFPFAVLFRGPMDHTEWTIHSSGRHTTNNVVVSKDTGEGTARLVNTAPINLNYRLKIYHNNFGSLSDITEFWMLNAGGNFTSITFAVPEADGETIDGSMVFDPPEPTRLPLDESRERGRFYTQVFPITLRTLLVSDAEDASIILTNIRTTQFI